MDTWFGEAPQQIQLVDRLLEIADVRRVDTDASSASVTRTAILRAGSLMKSSELGRFMPFLDHSKTILATLITMQRIVTNDPPEAGKTGTKLVTKLADLAQQYADPQVHERGKIGASLINAMNLLAVLNLEQFGIAFANMAKLNKPWLFEHLLKELEAIQQNPKWQSLSDTQIKTGENLVRAMEVVDQAAS